MANISEGAAGSGAYQLFNMNSVYDPDYTGAGSQPVGFDQVCQFYSRFRVHTLKYEVTFANVAGTSTQVGLYASPQSSLPAAPASWFVQPTKGTKSALISAAGGLDRITFRGVLRPWDYFGITKAEYLQDQDFVCTASGNPTRSAYLVIVILGGGVTTHSVRVSVKLWYMTECSLPVALSMS